MGRKSVHTPDELRRLIIDAATEILTQDGFLALSAREIARKIDYSPGTLYNIFKNIGDLLLTIEVELLDKLIVKLKEVAQAGNAKANVHALADAYLAFARQHQNLWNLFAQHQLPKGQQVPAEMDARHHALHEIIWSALNPDNSDCNHCRRASTSLWGGIHGITAIATSGKCTRLSFAEAEEMIDDLIETYYAGLAQRTLVDFAPVQPPAGARPAARQS